MATMEFWIQIENGDRPVSLNNDEHTGKTGGPESFRVANSLNDRFSRDVPDTGSTDSLYRSRSDKPANPVWPNGGNDLFLRRYFAPRHDDWRDAWTIPMEPISDSNWLDPKATGRILGPVLRCKPGDRIIVHFRNNDQRKKIITRMVEVAIPFGGIQQIPTPFSEPLPITDRIHSLTPHGFGDSLASNRNKIISFPGPRQRVGMEAALWTKLGINSFKKASRVPPGGTYTYTWDVPASSDPRSRKDPGATRFIVFGECGSAI